MPDQTSPSQAVQQKRRAPRPASVTTFVAVVLILAVLHLVRLEQSLLKWNFLDSLLPFSPLYLAVNGGLWGAAGLALAWGWWAGKSWAMRWTPWAAGGYLVNYWIERIALAGNPTRNINWVFVALCQIIIVAWLLWKLKSHKVTSFMGDVHDG